MKLATVMPVYNHAHLLNRSLCAILNQERQPDQIILLNDGSTDDAVEVARGLLGNVPYATIVNDTVNRRVVYRANQGLEMTRCDWIHFASATDEALPGLYEKSMALLAKHPSSALCCSIDGWYEPTGFHWHFGQRMGNQSRYFSPQELIEQGRKDCLQVSSPTCIVRREAIREVGGFRDGHEWHCDWFTYFAAAFKHGLCFIPEILSRFELAQKAFSSNMFDPTKQRPVLAAMLRDMKPMPYFTAAVRATNELAQFGSIRDVLATGGWSFITPGFIWKRLRVNLLRKGRRLLPKPVGQLYLNLCKQ